MRPHVLTVVGLSFVICMASALTAPGRTQAASTPLVWLRIDSEAEIDEALRGLKSIGSDVLGYEASQGYLVWAPDAELIHRTVPDATASPVPLTRKLASSLRMDERKGQNLLVSVYAAETPARSSLMDLVGRIDGVSSASQSAHVNLLHVSDSRMSPARIAALPFVLFVAPAAHPLRLLGERSNQVAAGNIDAEGRAIPGYEDFLTELDLDGSGVRVAVTDTGVDDSHPALQGSVVKHYNYDPYLPEAFDADGHGTAVAGAIAGHPEGNSRVACNEEFICGMGMAPGVELIDQNIVSSTAASPGYAQVVLDAAQAGASIWNASWTSGANGYGDLSSLLDAATRDANPTIPGSQDLLFVYAAGNDGVRRTWTSSNSAKNIIAVGATDSRGNLDALAEYSSWGPTSDGRMYPTVVAPGHNTDTTQSRSNIRSLALCGQFLNRIPEILLNYQVCHGTSMAAPHVSGAAALIHQWWQRSYGLPPSPAMVKALLINGAVDMGEPDAPNNREGWGRVNLRNVFTQTPMLYEDQARLFETAGSTGTYILHAADPTQPLKITVTWSDAPGLPGAERALVNDLDLVVERLDAHGTVEETWLGNWFLDGWSNNTIGFDPDRLNNVEGVHLQEPGTATYRIRVIASGIFGDAIPGNEDPTDQDYALVIRNAVID